jgi:hypothetical protein
MTRLFAKVGTNVLMIEEKPDGIFLYTFLKDGFVGDSWHQGIDHAKEQARYSYGNGVSDWREVPANVTDLKAFARENSN